MRRSTLSVALMLPLLSCAYGATTWQSYNDNLNVIDAVKIMRSPDASTYYAFSSSGQLFARPAISDQWNLFFNPMLVAPTYTYVLSLAINPISMQELYVSLSNSPFMKGATFKSTDGGNTWNQLTFTQDNNDKNIVSKLFIDQQNPSIVYALFDSHEVFQSMDGGETWQKMVLPNKSNAVSNLYLFPENSKHALFFLDNRDAGIYKVIETVDAGKTWRDLSSFEYSSPYDLTIVGGQTSDGHNNIYAITRDYVLRSIDNGNSWQNTRIPKVGYDYSAWTDPKHAENLYIAAFGNKIFTTHDSGDHYETLTLPSHARINSLVVSSPPNAEIITSASDAGLLISNDNGNHWQSDNRNITSAQIDSIWSSQDDSVQFISSAQGAWKTDPHHTWKKLDFFNKADGNISIASDSHNSSVLLAAYRTNSATLCLAKSADTGATWKTQSCPFNETGLIPNVIKVLNDPTAAHHYLIARTQDVYATNNDGQTVQRLFSNEHGCYQNLDIARNNANANQLAISKFTFCGMGRGLETSVSENNGQTWQTVTHDEMDVFAIRINYNPLQLGAIIIGTEDAPYFYQSTDNGNNWLPLLTTGLPTKATLTDFIIDPARIGTFYASFYSNIESSVYVSNDAGIHWSRIGNNLPARGMSLALSNQAMYVGTYGLGVYRMKS